VFNPSYSVLIEVRMQSVKDRVSQWEKNVTQTSLEIKPIKLKKDNQLTTQQSSSSSENKQILINQQTIYQQSIQQSSTQQSPNQQSSTQQSTTQQFSSTQQSPNQQSTTQQLPNQQSTTQQLPDQQSTTQITQQSLPIQKSFIRFMTYNVGSIADENWDQRIE